MFVPFSFIAFSKLFEQVSKSLEKAINEKRMLHAAKLCELMD